MRHDPVKFYLGCSVVSLLGLLATAASIICGCATFPAPEAAAQSPSAPELTMRMDPFLLHTGFALDQGDPIVRELRGLRHRIESSLELDLPVRPIEIYIFDDRGSYDRFMRLNYPGLPGRRAFFIAQGSRLVVYAFRDEKLLEDLRHETTHALLHAALGTLPLWLDEGLAEYFESPPSVHQLHARHLADLQTWTQQGWRPALTRLEAFTDVRQMTRRDYGEAWGWIYFMLHGSGETRQILLTYLNELSEGGPREPMSAPLFATLSRPDLQMVAFFERLEPSTALH